MYEQRMHHNAVHRDFWSHVRRQGDCLIWTKYRDPRGYGKFSVHVPGSGTPGIAENWLAHRFAWTLVHGAIPDGMCVLHACDNPSCVNPNHLWLGDRADNARDRDEKGRGGPSIRKGDDHGMAKLTAEQVFEIRAANKGGNALAFRFGVARSTITRIRNRQNWNHL